MGLKYVGLIKILSTDPNRFVYLEFWELEYYLWDCDSHACCTACAAVTVGFVAHAQESCDYVWAGSYHVQRCGLTEYWVDVHTQKVSRKNCHAIFHMHTDPTTAWTINVCPTPQFTLTSMCQALAASCCAKLKEAVGSRENSMDHPYLFRQWYWSQKGAEPNLGFLIGEHHCPTCGWPKASGSKSPDVRLGLMLQEDWLHQLRGTVTIIMIKSMHLENLMIEGPGCSLWNRLILLLAFKIQMITYLIRT